MTASGALWRPRAGLLAAVIFWGASFVATKLALRELSPATVVSTRFAIGLLTLIALERGRARWPAWRNLDLRAVALLGFLGITFHQWLQATGLQTATATITAWIVATTPIFVALLGWALLRERLGWVGIAGIATATAGALTVASRGAWGDLYSGRVGTVGDLLIALSAVNWAVFTVGSKRWLARPDDGGTGAKLSGAALMLPIMLTGWLMTLPWLAVDGGWVDLPHTGATTWGALLFLGVACSGLAYWFWYGGLERLDASQAGVFLYLEPLVTQVAAWALLGEEAGVSVILGGAAILAGVWLVGRRPSGAA